MRRFLRKAVPVCAGTACFLLASLAGASGSAPEAPKASCSLQPKVLDTRVAPGALVVRIELFSSDGLRPLDAANIDPGVYVASVNGVRLPAPGGEAEGISEVRLERRLEDGSDVRGRSGVPNGVPEAVVKFSKPSDGDPSTLGDGDAGDVLAMLTDVPDGRTAEICLAGSVKGAPFTCCDTVTVRNRGLRNLPPGLQPGDRRGGP